MADLTPPPTATMPIFTRRPPAVLRFLRAHLDRGRLDVDAYDRLHRVLRSIDHISLLLFPPSHVLDSRIKRNIDEMSDQIIHTLGDFDKHIASELENAKRAMRELPGLAVSEEDQHFENLKEWREVLLTLHEPSNDDTKLYRHIFAYFDSHIHAPFLQLHRTEPEHSSWQLRHRFSRIRDIITSLYENCHEANKLVRELHAEFAAGSRDANDIEEAGDEKPPSPGKVSDDEETYWEARLRKLNKRMKRLDYFFDDVSVASSSHSTVPSISNEDTDYTIKPGRAQSGLKTPRVLGDSLSKLETSITKKSVLHQPHLSVESVDANGVVKIKDFALHSPLPSPATLLERRDALSTREPTWEHRLIGGRVVPSRRHDRNRAQTVDERGGQNLETWLNEAPSPDKASDRAAGGRMRVLSRQHTL